MGPNSLMVVYVDSLEPFGGDGASSPTLKPSGGGKGKGSHFQGLRELRV